jgi:hypothetical protein
LNGQKIGGRRYPLMGAFTVHIRQQRILYTGYFTSDNEPNGIKMHPTIYFQKKPEILISVASFFRKCSVGLIFIPLGSLSLVKYPVLYIGSQFFQLLGRAYCSTYSLVSYCTGC